MIAVESRFKCGLCESWNSREKSVTEVQWYPNIKITNYFCKGDRGIIREFTSSRLPPNVHENQIGADGPTIFLEGMPE